MPKRKAICEDCGNAFLTYKPKQRFCSRPCASKHAVGPNHQNWKGTHWVNQGYVYRTVSPNARKGEHVIIAESALGRPMPEKAVVHHWDENPLNNFPSNLVICENQTYHLLLHARTARIKDTGSFALKRCFCCKEVKPMNDFPVKSSNWDGRYAWCKPCANKKNLDGYYRKKSERISL